MKNGPALAGRGAEAVKDAIATTINTLPEHLCRSLTWDRGEELAQHAKLRIDTGLAVYFANPHSPWQRGTNENTNGLLCQYFPKDTDLSRWDEQELGAVAHALNSRLRQTLGWKTPTEGLNGHLLSIQETGVATTVEPKQFTSWTFGKRLWDAGLLGSMGAVGDCHDNAVIESFWGSMQLELLGTRKWQTRAELAAAVFEMDRVLV